MAGEVVVVVVVGLQDPDPRRTSSGYGASLVRIFRELYTDLESLVLFHFSAFHVSSFMFRYVCVLSGRRIGGGGLRQSGSGKSGMSLVAGNMKF